MKLCNYHNVNLGGALFLLRKNMFLNMERKFYAELKNTVKTESISSNDTVMRYQTSLAIYNFMKVDFQRNNFNFLFINQLFIIEF